MSPPRLALPMALALALTTGSGLPRAGATNVVAIEIDDLNHCTAPLRGLEDVLPDPEIRARVTPNLARLAALGATFTNAQASTTAPDASESFKAQLRRSGSGLEIETADATEADRRDQAAHRTVRQEWRLRGSGDGVRLRWNRLIPTKDREDDLTVQAWERLTDSLADQRAAARAAEWIANGPAGDSTPADTDGRPRLIALHLQRPSLPWSAPDVFFDRFPVFKVAAPRVEANDLDDVPPTGQSLGAQATHQQLLAATPDSDLAWRTAVGAYLASVSYADFAVGRVLDAVEQRNSDDDPDNDWAVVLWSNRGFSLGQKGAWGASTAWEPSTHVNLMVYAPGITSPGQRVDTPVDTLGIAPTVCELAGVTPTRPPLGDSLLPPLGKHGGRPDAVALTTLLDDSDAAIAYSLRSLRFRLVQYPDGSQELYDHEKDPDEFYNLLDPANAERLAPFGLNAARVEAVRLWHGSRLVEQLIKRRPADLFADDGALHKRIDVGGALHVEKFDPNQKAARWALDDVRLEAGQDFLASLRFQTRAESRVRFLVGPDGEEATLAHLNQGDGSLVWRMTVAYSAAEATLERMTTLRDRELAQRDEVRLDEPLAPGASFTVEIDGAASLSDFVLLIDDAAPLPGDFNRDGAVNAADTSMWRESLGKEVPVGSGADGDCDGRVERDDRNVWVANYGRTAKQAAAPAENAR